MLRLLKGGYKHHSYELMLLAANSGLDAVKEYVRCEPPFTYCPECPARVVCFDLYQLIEHCEKKVAVDNSVDSVDN